MVGAVGGGPGGYDTAAIRQQMRSQMADQVLKKADANHDGKITEDELSKAMDASGSKQGPSAAELFKQLDQGNKGYITRQDIEDGLAKGDQAKPAQGRPPGKGGGGAHGGGGGDAATATSYDPADTNQDGVVTAQERVQYLLKLYEAQKAAES